MSGSSDRSAQLREDLTRYTDRWRATDRLIEQRVTLLVAAVTVCVALVAIDSPDANTHQTKAAVWAFAAVLCLGTFHRLVSGRISIIRSIAIMNLIRREIMIGASDDMKAYHQKILDADSTLPSAHKWMSTQMGAALGAAATMALCLREVKLWTEPLTYSVWSPSPYQLWLIPLALFIICAGYSIRRSSQFQDKLVAFGLEP